MNINSIIENIQAGLASGRDGKIKLTEHSYLLDLLDGKNTTACEKDKFTCNVNWNDFRHHRFPVLWLMMTFVTFTLKCIVFACYWLASQVWALFVGKKNKKELSLSPRFNFVLFVAAITGFVSMIVIMLVFLLAISFCSIPILAATTVVLLPWNSLVVKNISYTYSTPLPVGQTQVLRYLRVTR